MFWIEMSKLGYRKREPNEPAREMPRLLKQMVQFHRKQLGYSSADLAALLCLTPAELDIMYGESVFDPEPQKPHLRVVK
jgi:hypothetical protein